MSSLEEKKSELERVLGVFQNYIEGSELLDVVYSKKFGYVLLGLPAADSIDDSDVTRLEDPETLVKEVYQNLAYDFMEQEGHSEDHTEATNLEKRAMREWMKEYTDQLPEYNYLLDELLGLAHHTENLPMLCLKKGKKIRPMPRKAHEFRDFRGYLNWSYTP